MRWTAVAAALLLLVAPGAAAVQTPQVLASVWYRGLPVGVPRQVDLEAIRDNGFTAVTWPLQHVNGAEQLQRMAAALGLTVVVRSESVPLTFGNATNGDLRADLLVSRTPRADWPALMWRAVAHGSRTISFDAGLAEGTGLWDENGPRDWVSVAAALGRQFTSSAGLWRSATRGPVVVVDPADTRLDLSLLDNGRSWIIIVTNASSTPGEVIDTYATFPKDVPAAEWLNLFDGTMMSMLYRPAGSRWHVRLGPGEAKVFVIDKR